MDEAAGSLPPGKPRAGGARSARAHRFSFTATARQPSAGHTRIVRGLKLVLSLTAAALVTLLIAWPQLQDSGKHDELPSVRPEEASNVRIRNARYVGSDEKDRPYSVSAEVTRQSPTDPHRLELEKPEADITLRDGAWLALQAEKGFFDRNRNTLSLSGGVQLFHDQGYQVRADAADVDLKHGVASGAGDVVAQGPAGLLTGAGFRVEGSGDTIVVTGPARLEFKPGATDDLKRMAGGKK